MPSWPCLGHLKAGSAVGGSAGAMAEHFEMADAIRRRTQSSAQEHEDVLALDLYSTIPYK